MADRKMTPKDFAPHVLAVIGEMTDHTPGVVVPMEKTYDPVCARMKVDPAVHGTAPGKGNLLRVHRQIQLAMRQLRDNGMTDYPSRGQWTLTQQGLEALRSEPEDAPETGDELAHEAGTRPETEETAPRVAARVATVEEKAEPEAVERESNVVRLVTPRHPYSDDPYVRGLAIARTSCFGAFSPRSDVCKGCRLQQDCVAAVGVRKAEIAAAMLREEAEARRLEEARRAKKARQDASIDELIAFQEGDPKATRGTTGQGGPKGRFQKRPDQQIADATAQRESECGQCGGVIREAEKCYWVEDEGIFHKQCIEVPKQ